MLRFLDLPIHVLTCYRDSMELKLKELDPPVDNLPEFEELEMALEELNYAIDMLTIDQIEYEQELFNPRKPGELRFIRRESW